MKTNRKNMKLLLLLAAIFALPFGTFAKDYPLYLCGGATVNLKPDATVLAALKVGDKVVWQEFSTADVPMGTATTLTVVTDGAVPNFATDVALSVGEHHFKVFVISANPNNCSGDVSDPLELYVLPAKTLALGAPSAAVYCENAATASHLSTIVATPTPGQTLPANVGYAYTWSALKDASVTPIDGATIGTATSDATTGTLTVNTSDVGSYVIKASVKYTVPSTSTLKSGDSNGCDQASTNSQTIKVAPKPGKPTVTFS